MNINGYRAHLNSIAPGKGLALYLKDDTFQPAVEIKEDKMQITKLESQDLEVIAIYRSEQGSTLEMVQHLTSMIKPEVATVICGDFNICYKTTRNNRITKYLENNGFFQIMKEPTHIRGRLIDHFYFKPGGPISELPTIYRYSPYYSDHDGICATIRRIPPLQPEGQKLDLPHRLEDGN